MEKSLDWKPWYRQKSYNGDLTEDQKRYPCSANGRHSFRAAAYQSRRTPNEC